MIIVKFSGGLGNQMFQYALYKKLQEQYTHTEIRADISNYILYNVHYGFELDHIFQLQKRHKMKVATWTQQFAVRGELPIMLGGYTGKQLEKPIAWLNARTKILFEKQDRRHLIQEEPQGYVYQKETKEQDVQKLQTQLNTIDITKNWYIDGYWQNEVYFDKILPDVKGDFLFPDFTEQENIRWARQMQETPSVAVHIRRGDYVASTYDILGTAYYKNAIARIREYVPDAVFYFFSEDADYIRKEFDFLKEKFIITHNKKEKSWRDMQLMSLCQHNIVANSSFSVWGAYLNQNREKKIMYPSQYTKEEANTEKMEPGWEKIHVSIS